MPVCHAVTSREPPEGSWRSQPPAPQVARPQRPKRPLIPESRRWNQLLQNRRSTAQDPEGSHGKVLSKEGREKDRCITNLCGYLYEENRPVQEASQVYSANPPPAQCKAGGAEGTPRRSRCWRPRVQLLRVTPPDPRGASPTQGGDQLLP